MRSDVVNALRAEGYVVLRGIGEVTEFEACALGLGCEVGREVIALRPGAHAYVAKPGAVPLHTDHPDVDVIGWYCASQDDDDGASWLLDTAEVIESLGTTTREELRSAHLKCPPLAGGPPTERRPVLWQAQGRDRLFLPPWILEAEPITWRREVVQELQQRVSSAIETRKLCVRLEPGDALLVDNGRVLHGRGPISPTSRRRLLRIWLDTSSFGTHETVMEQRHVRDEHRALPALR